MAELRKPDRALVIRIVAEESAAANVAEAKVMGWSNLPAAIRARSRAMLRILRDTGCSERGLAAVWGCEASSVRRIAARAESAPPADPHTPARLAWQYGPERAALILAGQDEATNADVGAWRAIGGGPRA